MAPQIEINSQYNVDCGPSSFSKSWIMLLLFPVFHFDAMVIVEALNTYRNYLHYD